MGTLNDILGWFGKRLKPDPDRQQRLDKISPTTPRQQKEAAHAEASLDDAGRLPSANKQQQLKEEAEREAARRRTSAQAWPRAREERKRTEQGQTNNGDGINN